ncbi:hypothetical protein NPA07_01015 [Mycoplasmopsis caviae]|uniref:Uncharacterized protein n=1 Tax=Mycoplasmopsis caviae TaxID=55603 RepID=A0A3P8MF69_9BACT|nr:hypothetical protein [Mycoplasmopsis caviae]UUD35440.1 hypothetical protein NPA07_01015 [Mycoplasmopsis caviae]VDR41783.1 Uncharacterised protein [Mycoplasmopsis caviae]
MNKENKDENSLEITTLNNVEKFKILKNDDLNSLTPEQRKELINDAINSTEKNQKNIIANRRKRYLSTLAIILVAGAMIAITVILIIALIVYIYK